MQLFKSRTYFFFVTKYLSENLKQKITQAAQQKAPSSIVLPFSRFLFKCLKRGYYYLSRFLKSIKERSKICLPFLGFSYDQVLLWKQLQNAEN